LEFHEAIRPRPGEPVILKHFPNSFVRPACWSTLQD